MIEVFSAHLSGQRYRAAISRNPILRPTRYWTRQVLRNSRIVHQDASVIRMLRQMVTCCVSLLHFKQSLNPKSPPSPPERPLADAYDCGGASGTAAGGQAEVKCGSLLRSVLLCGVIAHSMTSSAPARSIGGMVRPSARAVFWLTMSSNRVGSSTGRSAGLDPFRILPTKPAIWPHKSSRLGP